MKDVLEGGACSLSERSMIVFMAWKEELSPTFGW
jgi:hypothetical protein